MILKQIILLAVMVIKVLSAAENDLPLFSDGRATGRIITNPSLPPCFLRITGEPDPRAVGATSIYPQYPSALLYHGSYEALCNRTALLADYNPYNGSTLNAAYVR